MPLIKALFPLCLGELSPLGEKSLKGKVPLKGKSTKVPLGGKVPPKGKSASNKGTFSPGGTFLFGRKVPFGGGHWFPLWILWAFWGDYFSLLAFTRRDFFGGKSSNFGGTFSQWETKTKAFCFFHLFFHLFFTTRGRGKLVDTDTPQADSYYWFVSV